VATLKHSFPSGHLTWLVRPRWVPLLAGNPYVDEVIPVKRSIGASWAEARRLRARHFDLAVDFQGLIQTALLAAAVRPRALAGFSRPRESLAAWCYSNRIAAQSVHVVDRNIELAAAAALAAGAELAAGAGAVNPLREFPLPPGAPEGTLPEGRFILASPFAGWGSKQWPLEYWSDLAGLLDLPLVLNGAPGSEAELRKVRGAHVHLSGIAGLIDATRRAHAVIGVDSGPLHLAAALNKPGVAIFGPTDPARNGPYGGTIRVLRSPDAHTDYRRHAEPAASMLAISPARVAQTLASVFETSSTGCSA
jgi:heptosyltransferase-1